MDDQIVRTIDLNSPVERVWKALTDHEDLVSGSASHFTDPSSRGN